MLERYVDKLLESSFSNSPMFWHYAVRHVPSDSLLCDSVVEAAPSSQSARKLKFEADEIPLETLEDVVIPELPLYGYAAFPLGGVHRHCFCGWELQEGTKCMLPDAVCTAYALDPGCSYTLGDPESHVFLEGLVENWDASGDWGCAENDLSDSWGVVPSSAVDRWIQDDGVDLEVRLAELLALGMGGLRVGNANTLGAQGRKQGVHPGTRVHRLQARYTESSVSLKNCESVILERFDADSVVKEVVDDLFPMAQGIHDSHVVSACLRFAIEYLRLRVMDMISRSTLKDMQQQMDAQEPVVAQWKTRCEVQLEMLGVCRSNALFEYVPNEQRPYDCPFEITDAYDAKTYYVTPGCLVWTTVLQTGTDGGGDFYDPCRLGGCEAAAKVQGSLASLVKPEHLVSFDVRDTGSDEALGTWPINFLSEDDDSNEEHTVLAALLTQWRLDGRGGGVPWRLSRNFVDNLVAGGGANARGGVGNTPPGKAWGTSEGFANESAQFCDAVSDWWPEDWSKPVGYHVTLPCHGEEAAYRTFDAAFFMQTSTDSNDAFQVTMRYSHTMLRNMTSATNEYGRSGFCRRGAYGMPTHTTNTVRMCITDAAGVKYDAHVPVKPLWENNEEALGIEYCADSPYDVPWTTDDAGAEYIFPGMYSVGHLAHYDGVPIYETATVPNYVGTMKHYVHPGLRDNTWGTSCTHGEFLDCSSDQDCVSVVATTSLRCVRNVCVLSDASGVTCYDHADCEQYDKMCSGEGICEEAVWQVENRLPVPTSHDVPDNVVEFDLFAEECGSIDHILNTVDSYDMWGGSKWETIPDVMAMYGMCSYRNWYEYREFMSPNPDQGLAFPRVSKGCLENDCHTGHFAADQRMWWDSSPSQTEPEFDTLLMSDKYQVQPHQCDRDYEHLENMHGCKPHDPVMLSLKSGSKSTRAYVDTSSTFAQTLDRKNQVRVATARNLQHKRLGFLSVDLSEEQQFSADSKIFQMCSTVPQCAELDFHFNGNPPLPPTRGLTPKLTPTTSMNLWTHR
jgi:hypothetical protein